MSALVVVWTVAMLTLTYRTLRVACRCSPRRAAYCLYSPLRLAAQPGSFPRFNLNFHDAV
jgi:hypothetical protein